MKSEKLNQILRVTLSLAAVSIIAMSVMKEIWVQLLILHIILLDWYDCCQPIKNNAKEKSHKKNPEILLFKYPAFRAI
jgi:hypothetical protein